MSAVEEAAALRAKLRQTQIELAAAKDAQVPVRCAWTQCHFFKLSAFKN